MDQQSDDDLERILDWGQDFPDLVAAILELRRLRGENAELLRLLGRPSTEGLRLRKDTQ